MCVGLDSPYHNTLALIRCNFRPDDGKFYPEGKPNEDEVPVSDVNGTENKPGKHYVFRSCGWAHSSSSTEGNFNLKSNGTAGKNIYWDSPWSNGDMRLHSLEGQGRLVSLWGMGNVTIELRLYT
ncbi:hypothetical protein RU639_000572 [Aspergillus parasiticus]